MEWKGLKHNESIIYIVSEILECCFFLIIQRLFTFSLLTFIQWCCILYMHIADGHILYYLLKWSFFIIIEWTETTLGHMWINIWGILSMNTFSIDITSCCTYSWIPYYTTYSFIDIAVSKSNIHNRLQHMPWWIYHLQRMQRSNIPISSPTMKFVKILHSYTITCKN